MCLSRQLYKQDRMPKYNTTCCCENDVHIWCIGKCMDEDSADIPGSICGKNTTTFQPRGDFCDKYNDIIKKCTIGRIPGNN